MRLGFAVRLRRHPAALYWLAMLKKRKTRELAMQVLYLWDSHALREVEPAQQIINEGTADPGIRASALEMADKTWEQRESIDKWLERLAPQWPPRRQPAVDRNLLRMAVWELTNTDTPPKVVIDEAIELAKEFSTGESAAFVNGVLDAVLKERQTLLGEVH
jgi:N utilization substance protein B